MTEPPSWSAPSGDDAGRPKVPAAAPAAQSPRLPAVAPSTGRRSTATPVRLSRCGTGGFAQPYAMAAPKPGIIPLRPLSVGEILDGTFTTIRRHPKATLGLSAAVACAQQGADPAVAGGVRDADGSQRAFTTGADGTSYTSFDRRPPSPAIGVTRSSRLVLSAHAHRAALPRS